MVTSDHVISWLFVTLVDITTLKSTVLLLITQCMQRSRQYPLNTLVNTDQPLTVAQNTPTSMKITGGYYRICHQGKSL